MKTLCMATSGPRMEAGLASAMYTLTADNMAPATRYIVLGFTVQPYTYSSSTTTTATATTTSCTTLVSLFVLGRISLLFASLL